MTGHDRERLAKIARQTTNVQAGNDPLLMLDLLTEVHDVAELLTAQACTRARADGASWAQIGAALGITKQAAQQRYTERKSTPVDPSQPMLPGTAGGASCTR